MDCAIRGSAEMETASAKQAGQTSIPLLFVQNARMATPPFQILVKVIWFCSKHNIKNKSKKQKTINEKNATQAAQRATELLQIIASPAQTPSLSILWLFSFRIWHAKHRQRGFKFIVSRFSPTIFKNHSCSSNCSDREYNDGTTCQGLLNLSIF